MGFIGSHTAVSLLEAGHEPILYDNLSNADRSVVDRIGPHYRSHADVH